MKRSDLTVAIATYNGEGFVTQAVSSALRTGAQVVVSDDGSTDATRQILTRFEAQAKINLQPTNQGIATNYQFLLERCNTPWLWLLNQDDVILRVPPIERDESRVTILNGWRIDERGRRQRLIYRRPPFHATTRGVYRALTMENFAKSPSQVIFSARRALDVGGFLIPEAQGQGAEDWMCWLRLASTGLGFVLRARPSVAYRFHAGNYSKQDEPFAASRDSVRRALPLLRTQDQRLRLRW